MTKISIAKCMVDRAKSLCTRERASRLKQRLQMVGSSFKKKYGDTNKTIMNLIGEKQERSQSHTVNYKHRVIVPYSGSLTEKLWKIYHKHHIRLVAKSTHVIKTRLNKGVHKRSKETHQDVIYPVTLSPRKRCTSVRWAAY